MPFDKQINKIMGGLSSSNPFPFSPAARGCKTPPKLMAVVKIRIFSSDNNELRMKDKKHIQAPEERVASLSDVNEEEKDEEEWIEVDYLGGVEEAESYGNTERQF